MPTITLVNSGVDHLYPDGVEIFETTVDLVDVKKKIARTTSLATIADPYFANHTQAQKLFSEMHGEGDRISNDFIEEAVKEILPIYSSKQRWIKVDGTYEPYVYSEGTSVVYRWENHDTRTAESKMDYTPLTQEDIRIDTNVKDNVDRYTYNAIRDYVLKELYRAIGYDKKYIDYKVSYEQNRAMAAFWIKRDTSRQTQYHYAGV